MKRKEIKLGHIVRCMITGFTGTAERMLERHNGNVMIAVQPKLAADATPGSMPDGMSIDIAALEYVSEGIAAHVTPVTSDVQIQLGWQVEDIVTGFKGIALNKTTFFNGCVYFDVQPKIAANAEDKTVMPVPVFIEHSRLKKISNGIAKDIVVAPVAPSGVRPGGPMTRMQRV